MAVLDAVEADSDSERARSQMKPVIYTIGHSNHSIEEFIPMLWMHEITCLVDVRTMPRSRHNPQFNKDALPQVLEQAGIRYLHMPELGGLRRAKPDSVNTGWRNSGFRGYADYMQTPEFRAALEKLIPFAASERIALMCAEAVPWRCHRSLLSDALSVRGFPVEHITSETHSQTHKLTRFARVKGTQITYPSEDDLFSSS